MALWVLVAYNMVPDSNARLFLHFYLQWVLSSSEIFLENVTGTSMEFKIPFRLLIWSSANVLDIVPVNKV